MPWLMVLQACVTLWLALSCWRYARRADEANAALWQGLASLRMSCGSLAGASADAMEELGARLDELDELELSTLTRPARCSCKKCSEQRALAAN